MPWPWSRDGPPSAAYLCFCRCTCCPGCFVLKQCTVDRYFSSCSVAIYLSVLFTVKVRVRVRSWSCLKLIYLSVAIVVIFLVSDRRSHALQEALGLDPHHGLAADGRPLGHLDDLPTGIATRKGPYRVPTRAAHLWVLLEQRNAFQPAGSKHHLRCLLQ